MRVTWVAVALVGVALSSAIGCGPAPREVMSPGMSSTVTVAPGEDVLRDVRKDAARQLGCQVPGVSAELGAWAGAQGNVIAFGCGYEITYYVRCLTNHQCSFSTT